jgi:hypothetical protein
MARGSAIAMAMLAVLGPSRLDSTTPYQQAATSHHQQADFGSQQSSSDVRKVADWVMRWHDNKQSAFVIIDKRAARLYVFDEAARLHGSTVILLGAAKGDDTVAGIGQRAIADVRPQERTTPAGRFLGERGHNGRGEDVVWVDYDAGVSIHRVLTTNPAEHRLARLASPDLADKRISYGCINVPVAFYESEIRPVFARHPAMVYVLPEVKPVEQVFTMSVVTHP